MSDLTNFEFNGMRIPERMHEGFRVYFDHHVEPGSFLRAVLENDLKEACGRADHENIYLLPVYVAYLYNCVDLRAWGSKEKVAAWLEARPR